MAVVDAYRFRATTRYAISTENQYFPTRFAACPVPECGKRVRLTRDGQFSEHNNRFGFLCDAVNMTPLKAARIHVDDAGRLVGIDGMRQRAEADE